MPFLHVKMLIMPVSQDLPSESTRGCLLRACHGEEVGHPLAFVTDQGETGEWASFTVGKREYSAVS